MRGVKSLALVFGPYLQTVYVNSSPRHCVHELQLCYNDLQLTAHMQDTLNERLQAMLH